MEEFIDTDAERPLFSLQRYFSLDDGILKYSKCLADVSIKGTAEGILMFVLGGWLFPRNIHLWAEGSRSLTTSLPVTPVCCDFCAKAPEEPQQRRSRHCRCC